MKYYAGVEDDSVSWTPLEGYEYRLFGESLDYATAVETCDSHDASLLHLTSSLEDLAPV